MTVGRIAPSHRSSPPFGNPLIPSSAEPHEVGGLQRYLPAKSSQFGTSWPTNVYGRQNRL